MKCDAYTAERIGLGWLQSALAPVSDLGRRADEAVPLFGPRDGPAALARCSQIVRLAQALQPDGVAHLRAALRRVPDPVDVVSRANAGDALDDVDFFQLGRFVDALDAMSRTWDASGGDAADRPPSVPLVAELLAPVRDAGTFYVSDAFSMSLARARHAYESADAALVLERERLSRALEPVVGVIPAGDEFILMRDAVPDVPAGVRVVRETPAYRLVALALDTAAVAATARRNDALAQLGAAESLIRRELAAGVAAHGQELIAAAGALGELDRTLARVAFTQRWGGCIPDLSPSTFAFAAASFVPLRAALTEAALPYTPVSLELHGVAVLTGPNMGGKSAALATCGFIAACLATGLPPPAERASVPLFETVAWIGGEAHGSAAHLLSAFAGEIVRTRDMLASAVEPALLLVDEFARTTGPREGRALLVALVEALAARSVLALVATHFDGVARAASVRHFAIAGLHADALPPGPAHDIHAALAAVSRVMDYRIVAASADDRAPSDALALAGVLGLDRAIVARAADLFAHSP